MSRRRLLGAVVLATAGGTVGLAAELVAGAPQGVALSVADFAVGFALVGYGAVARARRPASRSGVWMAVSGITWFAGTLGWPFVGLHRGFLVLLHLSYPSGRLPRSALARTAVAAALLDSAVSPLMRRDRLTVALSILVAIAAARQFRVREGIDRAAARPALVAALTFAGVLSLGAGVRLAGLTDERPVLWTYDLAIAGLATLLFVDLLRARWPQVVLRGLVLDLQGSTSLQARLAKALGDPSLVVGVWDGERKEYRDEAGAAVELPREGRGRAATRVDDDGVPLALLTHDEAAIGAPDLLPAVAAVARMAVANASLERRIEHSAREIAASRRRLVEAADDERRALQQTLEHGPGRRLRRVSALLAEAGVELQGDVEGAIAGLRELANGVRPPELENGLRFALPVLAERCPLDVLVTARAGRLPEAVEAAAYFVCSEALANAAKHSGARSARVEAIVMSNWLRVVIQDDGVGAADAGGPGLRGLADRVEALGGSLRVTSLPAAGTEILVEIPCNAQ